MLVGRAAIGWGYFRSWVARRPRYDDPEFRRYLRSWQWQALLRGKRRAVRLAEERYGRNWREGGDGGGGGGAPVAAEAGAT